MSDSKNTLLTWAEFSTKEDRPLTSRYLFTMVRPDLQANESTHPGTKWDKDFIQIDRNDIEEWLDFTEGNVNNAFCKVLDNPISLGNHLIEPLKAIDKGTVIVSEENLDDYFLKERGQS